jgi:hypothetical protein
VKKGLFGHRRTRSESESDYVCPLDEQVPDFNTIQHNGGDTLSRQVRNITFVKVL